MDWYYAEAGQRIGPIADAEFRDLFGSGRLGPENLVWRAGMAGWQRAGSLDEWPLAVTNGDQTACTQCGRLFAPTDLLTFESARVCAACKDAFFERLRELGTAGAVTSRRRYAGFWIRALARIIDNAILGAVFVLLLFLWEAAMKGVIFNPTRASSSDLVAAWAAFGLVYLVGTAASLAYEAWFLARRGGTPGKLALGLRVLRAGGQPLNTGRSIGRTFGYLLSGMLPFGIGYIMAGVDDEKRALHDRICDTRVVYQS